MERIEPICDGGGVVDERWTEPEIAVLNRRGRWMMIGSSVPLYHPGAEGPASGTPGFEVEILAVASCPAAVWPVEIELPLPERGNVR